MSVEHAAQTVAICRVCGRQNEPDVASCGECLARMAGAAVVSKEEADEIDRRRDLTRRRRRLARWGVAALVVLGIGAWIAYENIGTTRFLPPPVSDISADPGNGDWPMAMRDPAHSGVAPVSGPPIAGKLKWRFDTYEPIHSSPAVVGDRVFLSTGDSRIVALDAETGRLVWERSVSGPVNSSPAVAGGSVFVGLRDGTTLSLDAGTGEIRWEYVADGLEYSSPAVMDGVLYVGSGDRMLYALDAITGDLRWTYEASDMIVADPVVNGEVVAVNSVDGVLHIVDVDTGNRRLDVATRTAGAPTLLGDRVYVADRRGLLLGVDWHQRVLPFEKGLRWLKVQLWAWGMFDSPPTAKGVVWLFADFNSSFVGAPVLTHDLLYVASETGHLLAVDTAELKRAWTFDTGAKILASPSVAGDSVLVGNALGTVHALDALTGDKLWKFDTDGRITSTPVTAHGTVYVTSWDGSLYAIE
jgi:outer membrane protein assembly factor BamB